MRGRTAAVILLTLALLNEDDLHPLRLSNVWTIKEESLIPFRDIRHDERMMQGSFWLPVARASPLVQHGKIPLSNVEPDIDDLGPLPANSSVAEKEGTSPVRWREAENGSGQSEDDPSKHLLPLRGASVPMGWADPRLKGGQMLDFVLPGKGEPLNAIISGLSDPYILTPRGLLHYAQSLGFSTECLGIHIGQLHVADLGDSVSWMPPTPSKPSTNEEDDDDEDNSGDIPYPHDGGNKTEQLLARQNYDWPLYGWPDYGTCWESLVGGNHFRAWKQDGAGARTGAWFLAVSKELWVGAHHDIGPDGYNAGRNALVSRALKPTRWSPLQEGIWWETEVYYNTTLLEPGKRNINHGIAQDGRVAVLTVRRRPGPPSTEELEAAWGPLSITGYTWDADEKLDQRRAKWELRVDEGEISVTNEGMWAAIIRTLYRAWTL